MLKSWERVFKEETIYRNSINPDTLCNYEITCLDEPLSCIMPNDLVVIGADSGVGKSTLILNMVRQNVSSGKRVILFYLEGGEQEAIQRMKWADICKIYFHNQDYRNFGINMLYSDWVTNRIFDPRKILSKIEGEVYDKYEASYKDNLKICSITKDFTIDDLMTGLMDCHRLVEKEGSFEAMSTFDADLVIIDHLQYFSLVGNESEIAQTTGILRECKNISDKYRLPVILVSHLRKKEKDRGLPSQEDFYGSSNIPKISSVGITITQDYEKQNFRTGLYPTYFRIVKSRTGIPPNIAMRACFDKDTQVYEDYYDIYKVNTRGVPDTDPMEDSEKPTWAKRKEEKIPERSWDDQDS